MELIVIVTAVVCWVAACAFQMKRDQQHYSRYERLLENLHGRYEALQERHEKERSKLLDRVMAVDFTLYKKAEFTEQNMEALNQAVKAQSEECYDTEVGI